MDLPADILHAKVREPWMEEGDSSSCAASRVGVSVGVERSERTRTAEDDAGRSSFFWMCGQVDPATEQAALAKVQSRAAGFSTLQVGQGPLTLRQSTLSPSP